MRSLCYTGPNQLELREAPKPEPKEGEVLLRVRACGICGSDVHGFLGLTGRRLPPMTMGHEFSAEVAQLGPATGKFKVGDGVVVIEGIHALNPRLTALLPEGSAFKIYAGMREEYSRDGQRILPTRDVRLARRMVRDHKFRGHSLEKTFSMWPAVCEGEDKNIKVFKPEADLLLDTSFSYEVCCLAPFVTALRGELAPGTPYAAQLESLCSRFALCMPLPEQSIPRTSMLREFIG